MTERAQQGGDLPQPEASPRAQAGAPQTRDLFVFSAGGRLFAVFAEEVESVGERLRPAPLPSAPPAVLGVVPVRGRMRTALDTPRLFDAPAPPAPADPPQTPPAVTQTPARLFVALAGDEQLALACDSAEGPVTVPASRLELAPDSHDPARGRAEHEGRPVTLLDPARLFDAAMRGTDRRRRRS